jgi:nitrogen-specific signal transduction histidine kinase
MTNTIQEKFTEYIQLNQDLKQIKKQQADLNKRKKDLEKQIKEYMVNNDVDSISVKEGEIVLYAKKIPQTFKKESIVEKLTEKLKNVEQAEELTESILKNNKFIMEDKIRAVIRKK